MPISFDPRNDERNIAHRGLPFKLVEEFEWDSALVVEDNPKANRLEVRLHETQDD